jgi:hypothetical protein
MLTTEDTEILTTEDTEKRGEEEYKYSITPLLLPLRSSVSSAVGLSL